MRVIEIKGVGPVLFERSKRAKRIVISVKPFSLPRVAVPYRISYREAEDFVHEKTAWLQKHISRIREYEKETRIISDGSDEIDRGAARRKLVRRLKYMAGKHGFTYNRVFLRNQRTRWGSCSFKNNISLNIRLMKLPDDLVDYVILHELVHTRVKNHGPQFWKELDRYVGDSRAVSKKLKEYGLGLH